MSDYTNPDMIGRAFHMADESALDMLDCNSVPLDDDCTRFGMTDNQCREVRTLAEASPLLREAVQWLIDRGLARLVDEVAGEVVIVEDET